MPRTAPVAVVEVDGRRWVVGTFGDVHWVRNLRAAGEAEIRVGGRLQHVRAVELSPKEATAFFRDVVTGYVRRLPLLWRIVTRALVRPCDQPAEVAIAGPVLAQEREVVAVVECQLGTGDRPDAAYPCALM